MVTTLKEGKARLSELVERASRGEDVLITVRGKVKARLTRAVPSDWPSERDQWLRELDELRRKYRTRRKPKITIEQIMEEIREDTI